MIPNSETFINQGKWGGTYPPLLITSSMTTGRGTIRITNTFALYTFLHTITPYSIITIFGNLTFQFLTLLPLGGTNLSLRTRIVWNDMTESLTAKYSTLTPICRSTDLIQTILCIFTFHLCPLRQMPMQRSYNTLCALEKKQQNQESYI